MKKLLLILVLFYLLFSVINWLPGFSVQILNNLKFAVFILIFLIIITNSKLNFPTWFISVSGIIILLFLSTWAVVNAIEASSISNYLKDVIGPFLCIWIAYNLPIGDEKLLKGIYKVTIAISIICFIGIVAYFFPGVDISAPEPFTSSLGQSGLGGYRTGYANSLFLFVPFILYYNRRTLGTFLDWKSSLMLVSILLSQFLSGGRAGLLASLISILLFSIRDIRLALAFSLGLLLINSYLPQDIIEEQFRTSEAIISRGQNISNISQYDYMDRVSSFRLTGYEFGWSLFENRPLIGYGLGASDELTDALGYGPDIHNVWLKLLVDGGLIMVLPLMFFLYHTIFAAYRFNNRKAIHGSLRRAFLISIALPAVIITLLEPNYLLGSFQGEAFFWFSMGLLLRPLS